MKIDIREYIYYDTLKRNLTNYSYTSIESDTRSIIYSHPCLGVDFIGLVMCER